MDTAISFDWMKHPENPHQLILMRGVSGSGKSHRAKELAGGDESIICSADDFFGRTLEEYAQNWDADKLRHAHNICQGKARSLMQRQVPLVVIDNTNVRVADMMPYFAMAVQYQYRVDIAESQSPWWLEKIAPYLHNKQKHKAELAEAAKICWEKTSTVHGIPLYAIERQLRRYEPNVTFDRLAENYRP